MKLLPLRGLTMSKGVLLFSCFVLGCSTNAFATGVSPSGTITSYNVGWGGDSVRVTTTAPFFNPDGCPTPDGYITSPSDPGNHAYQAALLAAYTAGKTVQIVVSGCYVGRPQLIGVYVVG